MKHLRILLRIFIGFAALFALAVVGLWFYLSSLPPLCGNSVVEVFPSPNSSKKVVVFQRDCAATTGFSTQASVLLAAEELPNEGGNVFSSDTNHGVAPSGPGGGPALHVKWLGPNAVEFSHHPAVRIFKAAPEVGGVQCKYLEVSNAAQQGVAPEKLASASLRQFFR